MESRPPFPIAFVAFAGVLAVARLLTSGGDALGAVIVFVAAFLFFGAIYLFRTRRRP